MLPSLKMAGKFPIPNQRGSLMQQIYTSFAQQTRRGAGYGNQLRVQFPPSGKVRSIHYQSPLNHHPRSQAGHYLELQKTYTPLLQRIDSLKEALPPSKRLSLIESNLPSYVHQSLQISNKNNIFEDVDDAILMNQYLLETMGHDLEIIRPSHLTKTPLPEVTHLLSADEYRTQECQSQVNGLRNHLVASHWVTSNAIGCASGMLPGSYPLTEPILHSLWTLLLRDTILEENVKHVIDQWAFWGRFMRNREVTASMMANLSGSSHRDSMSCYSNSGSQVDLNETETETQRYSESTRFTPLASPSTSTLGCDGSRFAGDNTRDSPVKLHPLIKACQGTINFNQIRPFPEGSGLVSRLIMQDMLIRGGYVPVPLPTVVKGGREEYTRMIEDAVDGRAGTFVQSTLAAQFSVLRRAYEEVLEGIVI